MQITQKGQVTIPQHIREQYGLLPYTEVEFVIEEGRVIIQKSEASASPLKKMRGALKGAFTTEEIMALTRK